MVDRTVIIAENGRASLRGLSMITPTHFGVWQDDDENPMYTLDLSGLLGNTTIATVVRTPTGSVVSGDSNTTTRVLQRLQREGTTEIKITASDSQVFQYRITIKPKGAKSPFRDYGWYP